MSDERKKQPFKSLGERLKTIRQKLHESVAEVSGAVEIDEKALQNIEQGSERPSEDILMLLISHFGMKDDEAAGLWKLAGYEQPKDGDEPAEEKETNNRTMVMIMAVDPRIIFADGSQIVANKNGVVINFSQQSGTPQALITSRIGMSREQAESLLGELTKSLANLEPRRLPASIQDKAQQDNSVEKDEKAK